LIDDYPIFAYHDVCVELFGEKSPIGFDFRSKFGRKRKKIYALVDILLEFMDSINRLSEEDRETQSWMEPLLAMAAKRIRTVAACELGEFRILVFLQVQYVLTCV
jgi:hypothetical protein